MNTPVEISPAVKRLLRTLARKYEIACFAEGDPSCFLRRYPAPRDAEIAAFIAAMVAFGRRDQILEKLNFIFRSIDRAGGGPAEWILSQEFRKDFPDSAEKFYRFYSYADMRTFFEELRTILVRSESLGAHFKTLYAARGTPAEFADERLRLAGLISAAFPESRIVSKGKNAACKRIHLFLRWMVRTDSPVDLGLWTWSKPRDLLIPLDTHVLAEASHLGLFGKRHIKKPVTAGTAKNALALTDAMLGIFPGDPCKGDFALFGLGVDHTR